jgi:lysophospholipase
MRTYKKFYPTKKDHSGNILLVHGAGEHLDRYLWLINRWNEAGYSVFGGDLPGYGRSEGKKGHVDRFEDYLQAVESWYIELRAQTDVLPFIFGHSLGGLVVTRFMQTKRPEVAGVILSSPCFSLKMAVPAWKEWIAKVLNHLYPSLVLSSGIKPGHVSRSKEITDRYAMDRLNTKGASVRWYRELVAHMELNRQQQRLFPDVPLLIHQAGSDYLVNAENVNHWFKELQVTDKSYHEWPELYHEILNEPERDEVFAEIISWMEARSTKNG